MVSYPLNDPSREIMALFILHKLSSSNAHTQPSSGARCLIFGRTLSYTFILHVRTVNALARLRRLAGAFAGRLCGKYHNLMSWLECACAAIQWGQIPSSLYKASSSLYRVSEQRRLWRDCADAQARLSILCSPL